MNPLAVHGMLVCRVHGKDHDDGKRSSAGSCWHGIDRLGGGLGGGAVPNFRFAGPFWPKNGPLYCGQRGSEENTANTSKNGPELYIVIARNVLGTAQNTVNYGKICVFAFLGRCVSSLASGDGGHKTLQIALKIGCLAFSGAIFSAR